MRLRPYQTDLLTSTRHQLREVQAVCMQAPTGAGKTVMFVYMAKGAWQKGRRVTILVHRQELLKQTSKALLLQGVPHGLVAPGMPMTDDLVQVAMVQTYARRLDRLKAPDLLIIDECHHAVAGTWRSVVAWLPPQTKIVGVTATPERLDGAGLGRHVGGIFDRLVEGPSVKYLVKNGFLARPLVYGPENPVDLSQIHVRGGDYATEELAAAMDKAVLTGSAVEKYKELCYGDPAVVFCVNLDHAEHVAEEFRRAGIPAARIDGKLSDEDRARILQQLDDGTLWVITSVALIDEGFDLPKIKAAILLAPTKSLSRYLQRVGRALRPYPGKDCAIIIDHTGDCRWRHGLPDYDREWSLDGRKKRKRGAKDDVPPVRSCPKCWAMFPPAPICPACGYELAAQRELPEQQEGQLVLLTEEEVDEAQLAAAALAKKKRIGRTRKLADLYVLAKELKYKPAWAERLYAARHGAEGLMRAKAELARQKTEAV